MSKLSNPSVSDEEIATAYKEHLSAYKVADLLRVSSKRVYRVLGKAGIAASGLQHYRQGAERYPRETQAEIARLYASGVSTPKLAKQFGGSEYAIIQAILRNGGVLHSPGGKKPRKYTEGDDIPAMCILYENGMSQEAIAGVMGTSQAVVSRVLRNAGVEMRKQVSGGRRNDGRTITEGGYVRVQLLRDDTFAVMRDRSGYVLEHRIVMARALGRPLQDKETVHHINGDHADNRLENLQLRQGRHGKGIVLCCLDCGSHRIGPVEIAEDEHGP